MAGTEGEKLRRWVEGRRRRSVFGARKRKKGGSRVDRKRGDEQVFHDCAWWEWFALRGVSQILRAGGNHDYRCYPDRVNNGWPAESRSTLSAQPKSSAESRRLGGGDYDSLLIILLARPSSISFFFFFIYNI